MHFCVVLCICFVSFSILFVCIYVLNYCHRVATQLQLNVISYLILDSECNFAVPESEKTGFLELSLHVNFFWSQNYSSMFLPVRYL